MPFLSRARAAAPALALVLVAIRLLTHRPSGALAETIVTAFLLAFGLTPVVAVAARGLGAVDVPGGRRMHALPTPRLGAVAILAAFALALGRGPVLDRGMQVIAVAALLLVVAGAMDDLRGLSARLRLLLQCLGAAAVVSAGVRLDLFPGPAGAAANVLLSMIWIVGITNAFNFIDGMDGLATSLGALYALLLALVARDGGQAELMRVAAVLAAALLGFLPHNYRGRRPAAIFLGDGSAAVGFLLASLAIKEHWAEGDPFVALATPVLIFSVLIYDMVRTSVARVVSGRVRTFREWIDYVGRDHIHHRMTDLLGGRGRALAVILSLSLGVGLSAFGLRRGDGGQALLFLVHGVLVLLVVAVLEDAAARARGRDPAGGGPGS